MITDNCMEDIQQSARLNTMFGCCQHGVSRFYTVFLATFEIHISSHWRGRAPTVKIINSYYLFLFLLYRGTMKLRIDPRQEKTMCHPSQSSITHRKYDFVVFVLSKQCNYGNGSLKKINYKKY